MNGYPRFKKLLLYHLIECKKVFIIKKKALHKKMWIVKYLINNYVYCYKIFKLHDKKLYKENIIDGVHETIDYFKNMYMTGSFW